MSFRSIHPIFVGTVVGLLLQAPAAARTQTFAVEPVASIAVPGGAVGERWGVGAGIGVQGEVRFHPRYAVYAGYSATRFDLDFIDDIHALDRGFAAGVVGSLPRTGGGRVVPWARAGVLAHRLRVVRYGGESEGGGADGSVGFEAGAGIRMHRRFAHAILGLEYRRYSARVLRPQREEVSYGAFRVGWGVAF